MAPSGDGSARPDAHGVVPPDGETGDGAPTGPLPCTAVVASVSDECDEVPNLPVAPFIDGLPECGLPLYSLDPEGFTGDAAAPDAVTAYAVAWRPNGVYVYMRVTDPTAVPPVPGDPASYGDGVELYLDADGTFTAPPAYDDPGTRRFVIAAPQDSLAAEARGEVFSSVDGTAATWTSSEFHSYPKSFGYVVEAFITAKDLGLPRLDYAPEQFIAFDLSVNVSYPTGATKGASGRRLGQYFLRGGMPSPESDVRAFCRPKLLAP